MGSNGEQGWILQPTSRPSLAVAGSELRFPVHRIYCVGQNYREHAREMGDSGREPPFFFAKPSDAVTQAIRRALSADDPRTCTTKSNWWWRWGVAAGISNRARPCHWYAVTRSEST